jgi:hypothetical protein
MHSSFIYLHVQLHFLEIRIAQIKRHKKRFAPTYTTTHLQKKDTQISSFHWHHVRTIDEICSKIHKLKISSSHIGINYYMTYKLWNRIDKHNQTITDVTPIPMQLFGIIKSQFYRESFDISSFIFKWGGHLLPVFIFTCKLWLIIC